MYNLLTVDLRYFFSIFNFLLRILDSNFSTSYWGGVNFYLALVVMVFLLVDSMRLDLNCNSYELSYILIFNDNVILVNNYITKSITIANLIWFPARCWLYRLFYFRIRQCCPIGKRLLCTLCTVYPRLSKFYRVSSFHEWSVSIEPTAIASFFAAAAHLPILIS